MDGVNHQDAEIDSSNPYFTFDASQCIACYRCVRACDDIQGTYALTVEGRGFASRITAGQADSFMDSDCVSCGACVDNCPTEALIEKTIIEHGQPERSVVTTCAYCGVGCSFVAELKRACDMGSFPHELPGFRHVSDPAVRSLFESEWNVQLQSEPGGDGLKPDVIAAVQRLQAG